jgi:hypothetical protein
MEVGEYFTFVKVPDFEKDAIGQDGKIIAKGIAGGQLLDA